MLSVSAATSMVAEYKTDVERTFRLLKEETDDVETSGRHLRTVLLEQLMRCMAEHQGRPIQSLKKI